jgi:protein SCO1/2
MLDRMLFLRLAVIAVAAFCITLGVVIMWPESERKGEPRAEALIGGPFALTDAQNKRRSDSEFRGRHMLVFFGFTQCPDFCPTALATVSQAMQTLGPLADKIVPIFITVDPERDTPGQLKNYAQNFDPRVVMLTGSAEEIEAVARAYRVYYAKRPSQSAGDYTVDHSSYLYLLGPDGKFLTHFRHSVPPADLAAALKKRL